ncbi:pantoate--beta-alanine ligase [Candidatus Latescibacterota bacterium]
MSVAIVNTCDKMRQLSERARKEGRIVGFVPTMGALHEGHLSLVRIARKRADVVVVSIYVNPAQFTPGEDFEKYPRMVDEDVRLLGTVGADYVFTPDDAMIYPEGYATYVTVEGLTEGLCARSRPIHFRGVTTVVSKLFNIVRPHLAVFGQKDFQQLAVIRRMTADLNFDIEIIGAPIVREADGLAMSSRNAYLSPEGRVQATAISRSLGEAQNLVNAGETHPDEIIEHVRRVIGEAPLAEVEYIELVDPDSLIPLTEVTERALLALAVRFGQTRLIDNSVLTVPE